MAIIHFIIPEGKELLFSERHPQPGFKQYDAVRWAQHQKDTALYILISAVPSDALPNKDDFFDRGIATLKQLYADNLILNWAALDIQTLSSIEGGGCVVIHGIAALHNLNLVMDAVLNDVPLSSADGPVKIAEDGGVVLIEVDEPSLKMIYPEYTQLLGDFRHDLRENINELIVQANKHNDGTTSSLLGRMLDMVDTLDQNAPQ